MFRYTEFTVVDFNSDSAKECCDNQLSSINGSSVF